MKVRLNKEPNKKQKEIIREECLKEFRKLLARYNQEVALQILHILHFDYGYGQNRLEKFGKRLAEMQNRMMDRYEMKDSDTPWICRKQLEEDGIDVSSLLCGENDVGI